MGFVIRAVPSPPATPQWLTPEGDRVPSEFGPREKALIFATREEAGKVAKRWAELLTPVIAVVVEEVAEISELTGRPKDG